MQQTFLKDLRDAAVACNDILVRKLVRDAADELQTKLTLLHQCPTQQTMIEVNATWVKAVRVLAKAKPAPVTPPRTESMREERMAA